MLFFLRSVVLPLCVVAMVTMLGSCAADSPLSPSAPGSLIRVDSLTSYSVERLAWVTGEGLDLFFRGGTKSPDDYRSQLAAPQQAVRLFKVAYASVIPERGGQAVTAYGLVAIPENVAPGAPIVSYQHGTIFDRSWVPSNPDGSLETQFMISQFASHGYIVIAPDYFGTTEGTTVPNSYFVEQSTAQACLDMYRASRVMLEQRGITPGKLFLHGWSQGGYSTLAMLRAMELENIAVEATVTASGPADPLLFVSEMLNNPSPLAAPFTIGGLTNLMLSIDAYQGLDGYIDVALNPAFVEKARALHQFELSFEDFATKVPLNLDSVCTPQFFSDSRAAVKPFWKILDASAPYRFRMQSALRAFYSYRDEAIPWQVARIAADYQQTVGNVRAEAIDAGQDTDHRAVFISSLVSCKPWFDSLK